MYNDFSTSIYFNQYVILSQKYKIITPIISKNACSSLKLISIQLECLKNKLKFSRLDTSYWHCNNGKIFNLNKYKDFKKVAVIRDPIQRIISAYNTIGRNIDFNLYIKNVIDTFKKYELYNIDRHITSQFIQYDYQNVDLFIPIKKLNKYLNTIDIENIIINKSNFNNLIIPEENRIELLELLKNDYKIYNSILNSNKCFN